MDMVRQEKQMTITVFVILEVQAAENAGCVNMKCPYMLSTASVSLYCILLKQLYICMN